MKDRTLSYALRLASRGSVPVATPQIASALYECSPSALTALAATQRMAPWLADVLATITGASVDARWDIVRDAATAQIIQTMRIYHELTRVIGAMNEMDVPVVVLKGPALADTLYPNPALRVYSDVDLLIHERHLVRVSEYLVGRGYHDKNVDDSPHRLHGCHGIFQRIFINDETGHVVELHCDHLQIGLEPVGMEEIWGRAIEHRFGGATARILANDDLFVQLCVHLRRHGYERLGWFKDLDLMVRSGQVNWQAVREKAAAQGCLDSVSYALWLLPRMLGTPLSGEARRLVEAQGTFSRSLYRIFWRPADVLGLVPQRLWRFRRLTQFAPETGLLRGGLPSLLFPGRRSDKVRVLRAAATRSR